jgi:hypothetical protein
MPNEWSFRVEILKATQKWPWLLVFCLVGGLAGYLIASIWPSPYRITRELYVGLNVYRAIDSQTPVEYSGIAVVNANDYKNWQMSSLNTLIFRDSVINETLAKLKEIDPYWESVTGTELAESLHVYWRNAGKWRLVAENTDPRRATEAVTVWQDVVVEQVHQAVLESQQAMVYDLQLRALEEQKNQVLLKIEEVKHSRSSIQDWVSVNKPGTISSPVLPASHWQLWRLAQMDLGPGWNLILDTFPLERAAYSDYLQWIDKAVPYLDQETTALGRQIAGLEDELKSTADQFARAAQKSLGLSATLDVDKVSELRAQEMITRPTGLLMLIGSLIGMFTWLAIWISQISLRGKV